jgi:expansin (peptidoglycan-binding protein)
MTAVAASSTAMTAVAASSTAMTAVLDSQVARGAVWGSSTALSAIQSAPSAVLNALQSHAQVGMMNNNPSNLQGTFISGKSMTLLVRNTGGSDTNYLRDLAGGSGSGNDSFSTSTAWQTRVRAYKDIRHYSYSSNYTFQAYVVNMN